MCRRQEAHQSRKHSTDALRTSAHPMTAPLPPCGFLATPLRAVPDKYSDVRRGKREKSALLRNVG
jgi:hypothetical protein